MTPAARGETSQWVGSSPFNLIFARCRLRARDFLKTCPPPVPAIIPRRRRLPSVSMEFDLKHNRRLYDSMVARVLFQREEFVVNVWGREA